MNPPSSIKSDWFRVLTAVLLGVGLAAITLSLIWGLTRSIFALVLLGVSMVSAPLLVLSAEQTNYIVGVAPPWVTISSVMVVVLLGWFWSIKQKSIPAIAWIAFVPFWLYVLFGSLTVWDSRETLTSGVLHVTLTLMSWYAGVGFSSFVRWNSSQATFTAWIALTISLLLCIPSWVQWAQGVGAEGFGDRTGGIFGHPSTAGKVSVILICMLLPMLHSSARSARVISLTAVAIAAAAALPTLSRANIVALALVLIGWMLMNLTRVGFFRTVVALGIMAIIASPFIGQLIERFVSDPEGTDRPELTQAGIDAVQNNFWFGLGPNNFVAVMQDTDSRIARLQANVHNVFLLGTAELGLIGMCLLALAVLFLFPSLKGALRDQHRAPYLKALVLLIIGVSFIGWTGWGIMRAPQGQAVLFVAGLLWANAANWPIAHKFDPADLSSESASTGHTIAIPSRKAIRGARR